MKRKKLFDAMGMIDDRYVEEAAVKKPKNRKRTLIRVTAIAACFSLLLTGLSLWLFLPLRVEEPDTSEYAQSEYYDIIKKLSALTYRAPSYKNNFERFKRAFVSMGAKAEDAENIMDGASNGAPLLGNAAASGTQYEEVTDNQVQGVIEADLIKRSDKYIFYMDGATLRMFEINGENTEEAGSYQIVMPENASYSHASSHEFYLTTDCQTVIYVHSYTRASGTSALDVVALDVKDPAAISQKHRVTITGNYLSSRLVDGKLLLLSNFYVGFSPDFSDESTFVPQIDDGSGQKSLPVESIISPDVLTSPRYTVVCKLDAATLLLEGANAFLSYSSDAYVSQDNVFVTRSFTEQIEEENGSKTLTKTEISSLCYTTKALTFKGSVTVAGEIKDQYSLDEYEGVLRVVTTHRETRYEESDDKQEKSVSATRITNASLYCVDLSNFSIVASVEQFAPAGESVQSVRFDGNTAYVCTSLVLSDPVFFFDLSDLSHITYKDTGTIEGFSSSLVNFGEGFLLGIGVGDSFDKVKIEVWEESETGVVSVCKYEIDNARYSESYKSYLIDRSEGLVGLGITLYEQTEDKSRYLLLHFDQYNLHVLADLPLDGYDHQKRAVVIDGYLYAFGENDFAVKKIAN